LITLASFGILIISGERRADLARPSQYISRSCVTLTFVEQLVPCSKWIVAIDTDSIVEYGTFASAFLENCVKCEIGRAGSHTLQLVAARYVVNIVGLAHTLFQYYTVCIIL
jgi:hypothetical protein